MDYKKMLERVAEMSPSTLSKTLIIDGTNTFIRVFCNVPTLNENGDHVGAVIGFLKSIGALIRKENPSKCVLVFDGKGGSQRRRKIYSEYKGNRTPKKMNRFDEFSDLIDEEKSRSIQYSRLMEYLKTLPISTVIVDNIEADDSIAYIVKNLVKTDQILISSTDRDFLQLVNDSVKVFNPVKKVYYNEDKIKEEFGLLSENYVLYRALTGDSSDNIKGVKGVGLKTLLKLIPEFLTENLDIEKIYNKLEGNKSRTAKSILESKEQIELNLQLMQLDLFNISLYSKQEIEAQFNSKNSIDRKEFLKLFFEDQLNYLLKDPYTWLHNTFNKLNIHE